MLVFVLGINATPEQARRAAAALEAAGRTWPRLTGADVRSIRRDGLFVSYVQQEPAAPGQETDGARLRILDGLVVSAAQGAFRSGTACPNWETLRQDAEGNFVLVQVDFERGFADVVTDPCGLKPVFFAEENGAWIVSNSAHVLTSVLPRSKLDPLGAALFLAIQGPGAGRTVLDGVGRMPGGAQWRWDARDATPFKGSYFALESLAELRPTRRAGDVARELAPGLVASLASLGRLTGGLYGPITGGRDSRTLAALAVASGAKFSAFTSGAEGSGEVRVAREVARRLGVEHRVTAPDPQCVVSAWPAVTRRLLAQTDGMVSLWQAGNVALQTADPAPRQVLLGGHGGELARCPLVDVVGVATYRSHERVCRDFPGSMIDEYRGLLTPSCLATARSYVVSRAREYAKLGFPPRNVPDILSYYERQQTRDAGAIRAGHAVRDMANPFYSRAFLRGALSISLRERYSSALHSALLARTAPSLVRLAYSQRSTWLARAVEDVGRRVNARVRFRSLQRRKARSSAQRHWIVPLMPWVRELCLDRRSSMLWEFVDRDAFTRVTSPENAAGLPWEADGILKVCTVFAYEAMREEHADEQVAATTGPRETRS